MRRTAWCQALFCWREAPHQACADRNLWMEHVPGGWTMDGQGFDGRSCCLEAGAPESGRIPIHMDGMAVAADSSMAVPYALLACCCCCCCQGFCFTPLPQCWTGLAWVGCLGLGYTCTGACTTTHTQCVRPSMRKAFPSGPTADLKVQNSLTILRSGEHPMRNIVWCLMQRPLCLAHPCARVS